MELEEEINKVPNIPSLMDLPKKNSIGTIDEGNLSSEKSIKEKVASKESKISLISSLSDINNSSLLADLNN